MQHDLFQAATGFVGWHRLGRRLPWRRLATGDTLSGCWSALLTAMRAESGHGGEATVLAADRHPDGKAPVAQQTLFATT